MKKNDKNISKRRVLVEFNTGTRPHKSKDDVLEKSRKKELFKLKRNFCNE